MAKYLSVDFSTGGVYERSNEEKEGFEKHVSKNGKESWRKYYRKGVFGKLKEIKKRDSPIGEQIEVVLKNGEDYLNLQMNLYDTKGSIENRFAESFIRVLPNMKVEEDYRIFPYVMDAKEGQKYGSSGVSVAKANVFTQEVLEKVPLAYRYLKKEETAGVNDVPKIEFVQKRDKFRPTAASIEAKDDFLYEVLLKHCTTEASATTTTSPSTPQPVTATPQQAFEPAKNYDFKEEDHDDLPF